MIIINDLIYDEDLSDNDVMVYVFLKILTYSENYESCLFNVAEIVDQIYGEINSHSTTALITKSLENLMNSGYVLTKRKNQNSWHMFMTSYNLNPKDTFTIVNPNYLRKIVDSEYRNKPTILRFYMMLMSTVYRETKVGTYDRSWFASKLDVSNNTISKYMTILEKLGIIYVYRAADFYTSNTYGAIEDKKAIKAEGEKRSHKHRAHENANEKRKYVAMYQNFINGKEYPISVVEDIFTHMKERNAEIERLGNNARATVYDLQPLIDKINA